MREFDEDEHHVPQGAIRSTAVEDTAVQQTTQPLVAATNGLSFEGIGQGFTGFSLGGAPPDTNGAVGATQYVQTVNAALAVFDKATGQLKFGAETFKTLFSGFGGPCQNDGGSDPVVLYDKMANRWLLSILITTKGQHSECLAISTTSDATGSYNRYEMPFTTVLNDFPKWGVWPDAYYMTGNEFDDTSGFIGRQACAVNRNAAINGQPLQMVCLPFPTSVPGAALPSDMDGIARPAAGTPNFIFALGGDHASLLMFKFHVDFSNTSNSTFTGPTTIPVAAFNELCPGSSCVPQAGTTQLLSSIGDVPNHRVAYRNFGDHESIVLNHSVSANSVAGVRWYEIRNPNGTPTVFQQGTFQPDSNWRWMGSVAMDQSGDIAAGYSQSSSAIHPEIAVTGRTPSDPLGTLETENVVFSGSGSQIGGNPPLTRWGDYSAMTVDPGDDCTFFYTQEYIPTNGFFNWHTRIVSFKMNNCGAPPDFTLSASPNSLSVNQGTSGTSTITVNPANGFAGSVSLSASALPSGVTASFNPSSTTGASTVTFSAGATAATGTSTVTITGVSGSLTRTTSISLTVNGSVSVNLSGAFNINSGIVTDGTTFSGGGLDNDGNSYSSNLLGSAVTFGGVHMTLGPANAADAVANATVTLPSGRFSTLQVLAAGVNGNQASQAFTVHFSDGTSQSFTQSVSDWAHPQNFAGETIAATMAHRDQSTGATQTRTVNLFGYVFTLNNSKTVSSITLPATRNVVVLAISLKP
jgi:hypothetical protein